MMIALVVHFDIIGTLEELIINKKLWLWYLNISCSMILFLLHLESYKLRKNNNLLFMFVVIIVYHN